MQLRAHLEHARAEEEAGAAASGHCVDVQLRCLDGHACCGALKHVLVLAGVAGYICKGRRC